jgi:hypothetical protein
MTVQSEQEAYHELSYYTLSHPDPAFIHQNIVDAFSAQHASQDTKPIGITFALIGLYLAVEMGFTGREVQQAHMRLAKLRKGWPTFELPENRGEITVFDVISQPAGEKRDEMIHQWCISVWNAYRDSQPQVRDLVKKELQV